VGKNGEKLVAVTSMSEMKVWNPNDGSLGAAAWSSGLAL
jgi:hypothetical protein